MANYLVPTMMLRWRVIGVRPRVLEQMWREHPTGKEVWQEIETINEPEPQAWSVEPVKEDGE